MIVFVLKAYLKSIYKLVKGSKLPFVLKQHYAKEKTKLFLYLMRELGCTQKEAQRMIAKGRVFVEGKAYVKTGGYIEGAFEVVEFEPTTRGLEPIIDEEHFVVYDKPAGVLVHPQNRHTEYTLIDELRYRYGKDANITHRIDQETSGIVLCAKTKQVERDIKTLFENRQIEKSYLAVVQGKLLNPLTIEAPLLVTKHQATNLKTLVVVDEKGKASKTEVFPLEYFEKYNATLIEIKPYTGRQHQIRVHMFHVKHPILGDPIYGQSEEKIVKYFNRKLTKEERIKNTLASRLLLHANSLTFQLYNKKYYIESKANFIQEALNIISLNS